MILKQIGSMLPIVLAYQWVHYSGRDVPQNAVEAGYDRDGCKIYIGRAEYNRDQLPCKLIPSRRQAYISYNSLEYEVTCSEIMVGRNLKWKPYDGHHLPANAVPGGRTSFGETLYIGRSQHEGSLCVGKFHPSHGCLYLPYGGHEIAVKAFFEVLVS